ncbi:MAG: lysophospholipase [Cyanobacteria bacterium]|nr:lysophospholipase [Cyanobacteriota bacterium]
MSTLKPTSKEIAFAGVGTHGETVDITAREWGSRKDATAGILLVHGLGAHSGWFEPLGSRLAKLGYYALSHDLAGFGRRRDQGFRSRAQWIDDLTTAYCYLRQVITPRPMFVIGNSMGSVVAIRAANRLWPQGIGIFSPGLAGNPDTYTTPYIMKALGTYFVSPNIELELPYTVDDITQNLDARETLKGDPDRRFSISARMGIELLKLTMDAQSLVRDIHCPLLLATAGVDRIVDNRVTERFIERVSAPDKRILHYPNAWHDMIFEPVIDELTAEVHDWIKSIVPAKLESSTNRQ